MCPGSRLSSRLSSDCIPWTPDTGTMLLPAVERTEGLPRRARLDLDLPAGGSGLMLLHRSHSDLGLEQQTMS